MLETTRSFEAVRWTRFSWAVSQWLANPWLVTLTIFVVLAIGFLVRSERLRTETFKVGLTVLGFYWLILTPLFSVPATQLLTSFLPSDTGQTAEAVVVLSRGRNVEGDRYQTAISLVEEGRASHLFVTGQHQSVRVFKTLEQNQLSTEHVLGTICARTTKQEAYSAASILFTQGIGNIILITDPPHMLRSWLTFRSLGFSVIPHIEPIPTTLRQSDRSILVVREYLGLLSYAFLGRFIPRSVDSPEALTQIAKTLATNYPPEECVITADRIRQWIATR